MNLQDFYGVRILSTADAYSFVSEKSTDSLSTVEEEDWWTDRYILWTVGHSDHETTSAMLISIVHCTINSKDRRVLFYK